MSVEEYAIEYFAVLDSVKDSCCIIDKSGEILFVNEHWKKFAKQNGGDPQQTGVGVNYLRVLRSSALEQLLHNIQAVLDGERTSFETEYPCHSPQEQRWFLLRMNPVIDFPDKYIISHVDITKRRLTELELSKSHENLVNVNKRLELALHHLAHDIKGPLGSIKGLATLAGDGQEADKELMGLIAQGVTKLEQFIGTTLGQGKQATSDNHKIAINIEDLIEDFLDQLKYNNELDGIDISVLVTGGGILYSYQLDIQIIIRNLIFNAIRYRDYKKETSTLDITVHCKSEGIEFIVADNGIGIEKEKQNKIFENRFRLNSHLSGSGLGLYLVKSSVDHLGGSINVESTPGIGTRFTVWLPKNFG